MHSIVDSIRHAFIVNSTSCEFMVDPSTRNTLIVDTRRRALVDVAIRAFMVDI